VFLINARANYTSTASAFTSTLSLDGNGNFSIDATKFLVKEDRSDTDTNDARLPRIHLSGLVFKQSLNACSSWFCITPTYAIKEEEMSLTALQLDLKHQIETAEFLRTRPDSPYKQNAIEQTAVLICRMERLIAIEQRKR
jgi:hypothetical protein